MVASPGDRCGLVSQRCRARLGTVPQWLLGAGGRLGADLGRLFALGLRAIPLRPMGVRSRPLGLGAGYLCGASILGAGAGRLDGRRRVELFGQQRRTGLRVGAARVGRGVSAVVGSLFRRLLAALQPAVCGQRRCAVNRATCPLHQSRGTGRDDGHASHRVCRAPSRIAKYGHDVRGHGSASAVAFVGADCQDRSGSNPRFTFAWWRAATSIHILSDRGQSGIGRRHRLTTRRRGHCGLSGSATGADRGNADAAITPVAIGWHLGPVPARKHGRGRPARVAFDSSIGQRTCRRSVVSASRP